MSLAPPSTLNDDAAGATLDLLQSWLKREISADAAQWLDVEIYRQRVTLDERRLGIAIGLAARRIGREKLSLSTADLAAAQTLHKRWRPDMWSTDEAARVALLLSTWRGDNETGFVNLIDRLCATGELTEHVACLRGFAVFSTPGELLVRARGAARSSVQAIFEAIACHNPYPADHFDTHAFNHMVVKCVFSGVPVCVIVGLNERRNYELVRMMRDLVSERYAAGRAVPEAVIRWIADTGITDPASS